MTPPIHVQHVVITLQPGGLENGVVNVVNGLDKAKFRSSVCCLREIGVFGERLDKTLVKIDELGWSGGNDPRIAFKLANLFRRNRPDIVHTRNAESFYYGFLAAKLAGVPRIVHSEHGRTFDDRQIRFFVQRLFSRKTDGIFAVSNELKSALTANIGIPSDRIAVLYNGVDIDRFKLQDKAAARSALGINGNEFVVGSVGRLAKVKNYPLLLRAFARVAKPEMRLMLVGEGPERESLLALAISLGVESRVWLLGHRENVAEMLCAMDVFVLPSLSEGMSNTLLEALCVGVPVIASRVGGNSETIDDQLTGLLFDSGDENALTQHLENIVADPDLRTKLSSAGKAKIQEQFSITAMIDRYEQYYEDVMNRRVDHHAINA
jgi:sugar transferase (PEP-CTERM/EpsH1 system associated)